jgi:hypothetical protein
MSIGGSMGGKVTQRPSRPHVQTYLPARPLQRVGKNRVHPPECTTASSCQKKGVQRKKTEIGCSAQQQRQVYIGINLRGL